jgi:hypothetical protein
VRRRGLARRGCSPAAQTGGGAAESGCGRRGRASESGYEGGGRRLRAGAERGGAGVLRARGIGRRFANSNESRRPAGGVGSGGGSGDARVSQGGERNASEREEGKKGGRRGGVTRGHASPASG